MNFLRRFFGGDKQEYRFTMLRYEERLGGESTPVAVVAERRLDDHVVWLVIGRQPDTSGASELGKRVLGELPKWLKAQIDEATEECEDPLGYLSSNHPYNLSFDTPQKRQASDFLKDVVTIFFTEVLGVDEAPRIEKREDPWARHPLADHAAEEGRDSKDFSFLEIPRSSSRIRA